MSTKEFKENFTEAVQMPFEWFADVDKRVYYWYWLSALFLSILVYYGSTKRDRQLLSFLKYFFNKKVWLGKSAQTDYALIFFNALFKVFVISPVLFESYYLTQDIKDFCERFFGPSTMELSALWSMVWYTLVLTIVKDAFVFVIHYLFHKIPFLWNFHKTHHSATRMTPFTQFRIHPVEVFLNSFFAILAITLTTGVFDYLLNGQLQLLTILGGNAFLVVFKFLGANLRHSHVPVKFPNWIESWFISPFQHQIHHSSNPEDYNKNFGSWLAVWDRIANSLKRSSDQKSLYFGLDPHDYKRYKGFLANLVLPFLDLFKVKK